MTTIFFNYFNKKEHKWIECEKHFNDIDKALKFCYMMNHRDDMYCTGWMANPYEDGVLTKHIKLYGGR